MSVCRAVLLVVAGLFAFASGAHAEEPVRLHVLAIGYNGVPTGTVDSRLQALQYADDDAAAFARLARDLGGRAIVLSNLDGDTTRRYPGIASQARPPTLDELHRAVVELNSSFVRDRAAGLKPILLLSYSGHGIARPGEAPALLLADGQLTQQMLYDEVLAALEAGYVHLIVDACHAEAVVRPRDVQAEAVTLSPAEVLSSVSRLTLLGMPTVGAMVASTASSQSHEWDRWQQGVFTHEVLSGLRGAADVNGDLRVEYSEMAAFLSAANREVRDPGARIKPLVKAPAAGPRVPIVDLRVADRTGAFLVGSAGRLGAVSVETDDGHRLVDLRSESDQVVHLLVPVGGRLFVRTADAEAQVRLGPGERMAFERLALRERGLRARGALDLSLERGLFAASFGPAYYRGFVDRAEDDFTAVPLVATRPRPTDAGLADTRADEHSPSALAWTGLGVSSVLLVASAAFGVAALDAKGEFDDAQGLERASFAAEDRFEQHRSLSIGTLVAGLIAGGVTYVLFADP